MIGPPPPGAGIMLDVLGADDGINPATHRFGIDRTSPGAQSGKHSSNDFHPSERVRRKSIISMFSKKSS
jgi:hypothetical protein